MSKKKRGEDRRVKTSETKAQFASMDLVSGQIERAAQNVNETLGLVLESQEGISNNVADANTHMNIMAMEIGKINVRLDLGRKQLETLNENVYMVHKTLAELLELHRRHAHDVNDHHAGMRSLKEGKLLFIKERWREKKERQHHKRARKGDNQENVIEPFEQEWCNANATIN